ncbi:MAG: SURF1 family cytochrome oxidase biogenesis protein [Sphingomicrobium sp.]
MIRRLPLVPTIFVAAAVAVMIGLGLWQLRRAEWKGELIARYEHADRLPLMAWPSIPVAHKALPLFRRATGMCLRPMGKKAVAGANRSGETGYVFLVDCTTRVEGQRMRVQLGWSRNPQAAFHWTGGPVSGIIAPDRQMGMRLVAETAPAGLQASARPGLAAISNNHLFYAIQWFAFAGIALLIYALALRRRWNDQPVTQRTGSL